jgi:hypothetical protein
MSARSVIAILLAVIGVTAIWGVVTEGHQLSELRAEEKRLGNANADANNTTIEIATAPSATPEVPRELLQLRAEVARLSQQQRELAGARPENERLRLQLENRRTNSAAAKAVGGGYIRTSEAKWLGYNTPENTLQSFLWAKKNHDLDKYLEALTPDKADEAKEMLQNSTRTPEQLFGAREMTPVYKIAKRQNSDPLVPGRFDHADLEIEIAPDMPTETITFQQIEGQWKLQGMP